MTRVEIRQPDGAVLTVDLAGKERWTVGSGAKADYRIELSGIHSVQLGIVRRGEGYLAVASKQAKVFKLNGKLVDRSMLRTGDTIQLGPVQIVFDPPSSDTAAHLSPLEPLESGEPLEDLQPLAPDVLEPLPSATSPDALETAPPPSVESLESLESLAPLAPSSAGAADPLSDISALETGASEGSELEASSSRVTPAAAKPAPRRRLSPRFKQAAADLAVAALLGGLSAALILAPRPQPEVASIDTALAQDNWLAVSERAADYLQRAPSGPLAEEIRARAALAKWSTRPAGTGLPDLVREIESTVGAPADASFWEPAVRAKLVQQLGARLQQSVEQTERAMRDRKTEEAAALIEAGRTVVRIWRGLPSPSEDETRRLGAQQIALESAAWQLVQRVRLERATAAIGRAAQERNMAQALAAWLDLARINPELGNRQAVRRPLERLGETLRADWTLRTPSAGNRTLPELPPVSVEVDRVSLRGESSRRPPLRGVAPVYLPSEEIALAFAGTGGLAWAYRVGKFPEQLPYCLLPEGRVALRQAEPAGVRIVAPEGKSLWSLRLDQPPLPLVHTGTQLLVSEPSGRVTVYDLEEERIVGEVTLPLPLDRPATLDPHSGHLLIAARSGFLFEFDLKSRACVACRFTGHLPGSLRTSPVRLGAYIAWIEQSAPGVCRARGWQLGSTSAPATLATLPLDHPGSAWIPRGDALYLVASDSIVRLSGSDGRSNELRVHRESLPQWCRGGIFHPTTVTRELWLLGREIVRVRGNDLRRSFTFHPFLQGAPRRYLNATSIGRNVVVCSRAVASPALIVEAVDDHGEPQWQAVVRIARQPEE